MKFKIYSLILILTSIFTISINSVFGDSDFILELVNVNTVPTISNVEIDGENVQEICPTSNCELEFTNNSSFNPPESNNMTISHSINFNLKYNSTDVTSDPIKKEYSEKFSESMNACIIYDIIKKKGHDIYFCNDRTNTMNRISDSKTWYYESMGIYDAIKNTYIVKGDLIDNST
jgi:hypothetical protein